MLFGILRSVWVFVARRAGAVWRHEGQPASEGEGLAPLNRLRWSAGNSSHSLAAVAHFPLRPSHCTSLPPTTPRLSITTPPHVAATAVPSLPYFSRIFWSMNIGTN